MDFNHDIITFQADKHGLVPIENFKTVEEYCIFLMHLKAYDEAAKLAHKKNVLDIGCNNGYGTEVISNHCKSIIGVDVSSQAIAEAGRKFAADKIEFKIVDGVRLPFKDDTFDLIVSFQVIEHIADYNSYLSEIKRVLIPTGKVLFTTPNAKIRLEQDMKPWNPFHVKEFSPEDLKALLESFFQKVKIQGLFAKEHFYSVEFNRVKRTKEEARKRADSVRAKFRDNLPEFALEGIKKTLDFFRNKNNSAELDMSAIQKYSTADLFYRDDNLDKALDLRAICGKNTI